jgi:hypothetical protein
LPPKIINQLLKGICHLEIWLTERMSLPFGTTLYVVLSKPVG